MKEQIVVHRSRLTVYVLISLGAAILADAIVVIVLLINGSIAVKGMAVIQAILHIRQDTSCRMDMGYMM